MDSRMTGRNRGRVLVFGDDMRIFLAIVRSLGRAGREVHVVPFNWHSPALKSKYISKVHQLPRYSEEPKAWLASLQEILRRQTFDLVIPCCDRTIIALDLHRHELPGDILAIPGPRSMQLLFDKDLTRRLCAGLGIPVVTGRTVKAGDSARGLIREFGLPLVVKPRRSVSADNLEAWEKVSIAKSEEELEKLLATQEEPSRYLVESFFPGAGVGVSVLAKDGMILQVFQHRRLRERKAGPSTYRVSEEVHEGLYEACARICTHTGMTGVCMFEFRCNRQSGQWVLLETNARFWGSLALPVAIGVDFPGFLYDLVACQLQHPRVHYRAGIRSRNFMLDGVNLLRKVPQLQRSEIFAWLSDVGDFLLQPFGWISGREHSDSFVRDDLKPALWECAGLLQSLLRGSTKSGSADLSRRASDAMAQPEATRTAA